MTRKLEEDPTHKKAQQAGTMNVGETGPTGSSPAVAGCSQQAATDKLWKHAPMTFKADYEEVPGSGKDRVKLREANDALWIDLSVQSLVPNACESTSSKGLVAGSGAKLVDTFSAPMTDGPSGHGIGKVAAQLHHADRFTSSLTVAVKLPNHASAGRARAEAIKFIKTSAVDFGDVDQLEARATSHLAEHGFDGAHVTIERNDRVTKDVSQSSFHYRLRGASQVLLDVEAADAGQSAPESYEITKDKSEDSETESERHHEDSEDRTVVSDSKRETERHHEHSDDRTDVQYNKRVVETLVDIVEQVSHLRTNFVTHVTNEVTTKSKFNELKEINKDWGERAIGSSSSSKTGHKEVGEKDRRNIANDIKDVTETINDVVSLPGLKYLKYVRRLAPWWLVVNGIDLVAGKFKAKGKVRVEDTKDESSAKHDEHNSGHAKDTQSHSGDRTDSMNQRGEITRDIEQASQSLWSNFKNRVETTTETYRSRTAKESAGGSDRTENQIYQSKTEKTSEGGSDRKKEQKRSGTSVTFSASRITKFTKPVVKPTVVSGDCEVSTEPFGVEKKQT